MVILRVQQATLLPNLKSMRARIELGRVFAIELRLHCSWPMPCHSNLHLVGMIARSGVFQMLQSRLDLNAG